MRAAVQDALDAERAHARRLQARVDVAAVAARGAALTPIEQAAGEGAHADAVGRERANAAAAVREMRALSERAVQEGAAALEGRLAAERRACEARIAAAQVRNWCHHIRPTTHHVSCWLSTKLLREGAQVDHSVLQEAAEREIAHLSSQNAILEAAARDAEERSRAVQRRAKAEARAAVAASKARRQSAQVCVANATTKGLDCAA